ncbi:hypothetical protein L13192_08669 [Pyrenophora tritici-repentis]|nr:hypothetical protein L13192_08669 [Pyrenophora tritici-repentis]
MGIFWVMDKIRVFGAVDSRWTTEQHDIRPEQYNRSPSYYYTIIPVFDNPSQSDKRSLSLPDSGVSELEGRAVSSGSFSIQWILHLSHATDFILKSFVTFAQGQVYAVSGSGTYASPVAGIGNDQGQFRVSYLSGNGVYTAVARIVFDLAIGAVVAAFDEGAEKNGAEVRSNLEASFKAG